MKVPYGRKPRPSGVSSATHETFFLINDGFHDIDVHGVVADLRDFGGTRDPIDMFLASVAKRSSRAIESTTTCELSLHCRDEYYS